MRNLLFPFILAAYLISRSAAAGETAQELPALNADLQWLSVSGISSGGFMATQLATAYSSRIMGVGVVAGGPYYCSGTNGKPSPQSAMAFCMNPASAAVGPDARVSFARAGEFARAGTIDDVAGLARQRVYLFSGGQDKTVVTRVVDEVRKFYLLAHVPPDRIVYRTDPGAGHAFITSDPRDLPCGETRLPYVNNCGIAQADDILSHLYRERAPVANPGGARGNMLRFNQKAFVKGTRTSMDDSAYVYIPAACGKQRCAVHVAIHGCKQGISDIGAEFYLGAGYNDYADRNGVIVLYPQVDSRALPQNPAGCWDFWGYSSEDQSSLDFHTRNAPQMKAIMAMVERLGQAPSAN